MIDQSKRQKFIDVSVPFLSILLVFLAHPLVANSINSIALSRAFFDPRLKQSVQLSFTVSQDGIVSARITDENGTIMRALTTGRAEKAGKVILEIVSYGYTKTVCSCPVSLSSGEHSSSS